MRASSRAWATSTPPKRSSARASIRCAASGRISRARWKRLAPGGARDARARARRRRHARCATSPRPRAVPGYFQHEAAVYGREGIALPRVRDADPRAAPGPALDLLLPGVPAMSATGARWALPARALETQPRRAQALARTDLGARSPTSAAGRMVAPRPRRTDRRAPRAPRAAPRAPSGSRSPSWPSTRAARASSSTRSSSPTWARACCPRAWGARRCVPTEIHLGPLAAALDPAAAHRDARKPQGAARIHGRARVVEGDTHSIPPIPSPLPKPATRSPRP